MGSNYYIRIERPYENIGDEGLEGFMQGNGFIHVRGPCGQEHTMSRRAAAQLRDWLDEKLGGPPTIDGEAVAESKELRTQ